MDTLSSYNEDNNNLVKSDIGIVIAVLESGNSVELTATGYSMFPTLRPDDQVIVKPWAGKEFPKPGCVVVYIENNLLVMHRLINIIHGNYGNPLFLTRGDSGIKQDKPWSSQQLIGRAVTYKRGKKEHSVKSYIPAPWRYKFNHRLIWLYIKMKS